MEGALEGPHPVFEEHDEEFLLDHGWSIVKREEVGKGMCIVFRFRKDAVLVKVGNGPDRLGHQPVRRRGVLAALELLDPFVMTGGAGVRCGDLCFGHIFRGFVVGAMSDGVVDLVLAVLAQLPVVHNAGSDLLVALQTDLGKSLGNKEDGE